MSEKKTDAFESSMEELKKMSEKIKNADLPLDETVKCYEEGIKYYKECMEILASAKQKIEVFEGEI